MLRPADRSWDRTRGLKTFGLETEIETSVVYRNFTPQRTNGSRVVRRPRRESARQIRADAEGAGRMGRRVTRGGGGGGGEDGRRRL